MPPPPLPSPRPRSTRRILVFVLGGLVAVAVLAPSFMVVVPAIHTWLSRPTSGMELTLALELDTALDAEARAAELESTRGVLEDRLQTMGIGYELKTTDDGRLRVRLPASDDVGFAAMSTALTRTGAIEFHRVHATGPEKPDSYTPDTSGVRAVSLSTEYHGQSRTEQLWVSPIPGLTGAIIEDAYVYPDPQGVSQIGIRFTPAGGARFAEVTGTMQQDFGQTGQMGRIAIVVDGEAIAAPTVREKITGGTAVISGSFTQREALELANLLNNPLHVRVRIVDQRPFGR